VVTQRKNARFKRRNHVAVMAGAGAATATMVASVERKEALKSGTRKLLYSTFSIPEVNSAVTLLAEKHSWLTELTLDSLKLQDLHVEMLSRALEKNHSCVGLSVFRTSKPVSQFLTYCRRSLLA
jgi:hypothetical protein